MPGHPRALHLLGVIAHKTGRPGVAAKKISERGPSIFEDEAPARAFETFLGGICPAD